MSKHLLVFGSLRQTSKRGFNFDRFGKGTQRHIKTLTLNGYDMHSLGAYPAICPGDGSIKVELHEVEDGAAERIERMEIGAGYTGIQVPVEHEGQTIQSTIYTWPKDRLVARPKVETGDWE